MYGIVMMGVSGLGQERVMVWYGRWPRVLEHFHRKRFEYQRFVITYL